MAMIEVFHIAVLMGTLALVGSILTAGLAVVRELQQTRATTRAFRNKLLPQVPTQGTSSEGFSEAEALRTFVDAESEAFAAASQALDEGRIEEAEQLVSRALGIERGENREEDEDTE